MSITDNVEKKEWPQIASEQIVYHLPICLLSMHFFLRIIKVHYKSVSCFYI